MTDVLAPATPEDVGLSSERLARIDAVHDLLFVGLISRMIQEGMTPWQALTQRLMAEALAG